MERAESIWRPLGELLVEKKLLTEDELELALTEQAESGRLLGAILVERGYVSGPALAIALAEQYGVELHTERGFGTGLWAEIDRRHRAGRGAEPEPEEIAFEFRYAGFDELWDTLIRIAGPLARVIKTLPDAEREATRAAIEENLAPYRNQDGSYTAPAVTWGVLVR